MHTVFSSWHDSYEVHCSHDNLVDSTHKHASYTTGCMVFLLWHPRKVVKMGDNSPSKNSTAQRREAGNTTHRATKTGRRAREREREVVGGGKGGGRVNIRLSHFRWTIDQPPHTWFFLEQKRGTMGETKETNLLAPIWRQAGSLRKTSRCIDVAELCRGNCHIIHHVSLDVFIPGRRANPSVKPLTHPTGSRLQVVPNSKIVCMQP